LMGGEVGYFVRLDDLCNAIDCCFSHLTTLGATIAAATLTAASIEPDEPIER